MLISPRMLLDRMRHPRSRADELAALRARFRAQPGRAEATDREIELCDELRALRSAASDALGGLATSACRGCARGHPGPPGRWPGGHCCGGRTLEIWSADEVRTLKVAGGRASSLEPPRSEHAGCAFRGPEGCSLPPEDRPTICVRYVCTDLRREITEHPEGAGLMTILKRIAQAQRELAELREEAV